MDAEIYAEMEALVRDLAGVLKNGVRLGDLVVTAQAIVTKLPEPIDPDLLAVREIVAGIYDSVSPSYAKGIRAGIVDDTSIITTALQTYKSTKPPAP